MDKIHSFQTEGRAIVLVSHSAEQVESVCTRGVVLDHGKLVFDGSTSDAVRILREGFQRDALAAPVHTEETGFITIRDISMTDQAASPSAWRTPDTICIRMDLTASKRIENWVTAFSLDTNLGQKLHYYNSRNSGATLPVHCGRRDGDHHRADPKKDPGRGHVSDERVHRRRRRAALRSARRRLGPRRSRKWNRLGTRGAGFVHRRRVLTRRLRQPATCPAFMTVLAYGIMVADSIALDNTTRHAPRARKGENP